MADKRHRAAIVAELRRYKAAVATIHDLLHRGDVNGAHEACECAMQGGQVSQPSLSVGDTATVQDFAAAFNELAQRLGVRACAISAVPVVGDPRRVSLQLCGDVDVCRVVEQTMRGQASLYMGDHGAGKGNCRG